jgi:hypothetical protein
MPSEPEIEASISDEASDPGAVFDELGWEVDVEEQPVPPPPPSSAVALPPHRPPASRAGSAGELPSIIVDVVRELGDLVDRVIAGESDEQEEAELLRQGERAMQAVMTRFPGPVGVDRSRFASMTRLPRPSDCGPVLRLVVRERKVALPFVLERLEHDDDEVRGWATHLLCELPYPEAIPHLLVRLRDTDASIRVSAAHALAAIGRSHPEEVRSSLLLLAHEVDPYERTAALRAIAELRQPALVPELVRALGDGDETVVVAAHDALVRVTLQDLGMDARLWLRWWEQNGSRHRVEWLIEALTHEVSEIRRAASEELRAISNEYFGYAADLPPRDRERARQRYQDWWITEGRARFRRV